MHVVHELPDPAGFLAQLHRALRPGGRLLISEPKGHVTPPDFEATLALAEKAGFTRSPEPVATRSLAAVLVKPGGGTTQP
jgi:SAM-dependent methyltransferase